MDSGKLNFDHQVKILTIGDGSVGKTSFILRFADNDFNHEYQMTVGVDYKVKTVDINGFKLKMNVWDTAGQDRFKVIVESYYRNADGIFILYAINNRESFENVKTWLNQIREKTQDLGIVIYLIGSKCDLEHERKVTFDEGKALADSLHIHYFRETSSMKDIGVKESFHLLAEKLIENFKNQDDVDDIKPKTDKDKDNIVTLHQSPKNNTSVKSKKCCS